MTALDHAMRWIHGEMVEGGVAIAFGLLLVLCGGLLWKFGESSAARAMVMPLLAVGGAIAVLCTVMEVNNVLRVEAFRQAHALDPSAFAEQEIERVQGFMGWYRYTFAGGALLVFGGLAVFLMRGAPAAKAVGLAMIVLGATALHFDFFSKARATRYLDGLTVLVRGEARADAAEAMDGLGADQH
ncbi:MAG: hypothetical protein F4205_14110 [Gemmatimonadetes bacterium]|nr:hypothetical protein [Gemmatimonadota bacterium]MYG36619.1 hypothetical protein [Gemmatimonadota bacterium]